MNYNVLFRFNHGNFVSKQKTVFLPIQLVNDGKRIKKKYNNVFTGFGC